ncbi:MAG: amino acid transport protein [Planctomycetota bacterium]|jgi:hypothetical protein
MPGLDIDPTSPAFLAGILVSTVGLVLFMYGKRASRPPQFGAGVFLMVVPYFVHSVLWLSGVAGLTLTGLWLLTHGKS